MMTPGIRTIRSGMCGLGYSVTGSIESDQIIAKQMGVPYEIYAYGGPILNPPSTFGIPTGQISPIVYVKQDQGCIDARQGSCPFIDVATPVGAATSILIYDGMPTNAALPNVAYSTGAWPRGFVHRFNLSDTASFPTESYDPSKSLGARQLASIAALSPSEAKKALVSHDYSYTTQIMPTNAQGITAVSNASDAAANGAGAGAANPSLNSSLNSVMSVFNSAGNSTGIPSWALLAGAGVVLFMAMGKK